MFYSVPTGMLDRTRHISRPITKLSILSFALNNDSDQPGHFPRLIKVIAVCMHWIAKCLRFLYANSENSDQAGQLPR